MKKIDKLILQGFIGPYLMSFFVAEFVLLMQFLWKNIDEILGKGFSIFELLELIFYFGLTIIPLSVPVTILISSVMVFGNLSERYELSSMKSAGIPLTRIMKSAIYLAIATAGFSLLASNYLKPKANFKFQQRFKSIQKSKPSLSLEEGVFDDDFSGYVIRIGEKGENGIDISDILLYDQENVSANVAHITKAETGEMYTTEDGNLFVMNLKDGEQLKELDKSRGKEKGKTYPLMRTYFKSYKKVFDMSQFDVEDDNININRNKKDMLNTWQLLSAIDSLHSQSDQVMEKIKGDFDNLNKDEDVNHNEIDDSAEQVKEEKKLNIKQLAEQYNRSPAQVKRSIKKSIQKAPYVQMQIDTLELDTISRFASTIRPEQMTSLYTKTYNSLSNSRDILRARVATLNSHELTRSRYMHTLHQQYSWAVACIVFLFIGAPLGSIIRKGGYGYPLLFSIIFYMLLFISSIMGNKLNRNGTLGPYISAWLPILILLPFAVLITFKALRDRKFSININLPKWLSKPSKDETVPTTD